MTQSRLIIAATCAFFMLPLAAHAQVPDMPEEVLAENAPEQSALEQAAPETPQAVSQDEVEAAESGFKPEEYASLVFTFWEHTAIQDARNSRGSVRAPTEAELMRELNSREDDVEKVKPPPEERDISLNGIVYRGAGDWTIWLNSKRVTPDAVPEEVIDLRVFDEYIEIKWFDEYTNQVFPIRLRPHQRFNIDARMFLPG